MKSRVTLYADDDMILTDGNRYASIIHLEVGDDGSAFHEIPYSEYEKIKEAEQEEIV